MKHPRLANAIRYTTAKDFKDYLDAQAKKQDNKPLVYGSIVCTPMDYRSLEYTKGTKHST